MKKVISDTVTGVWATANFCGLIPLPFEDFVSRLPNLRNGEEIACQLTDEQAEQVRKEYGIHQPRSENTKRVFEQHTGWVDRDVY